MGAKTAALACKRFFKFRKIIPCHYGTFPILDQSPDKFKAELGGDAGKVLVPEKGKPVDI
jgi:L-ascorbate metabolism protein UlaG (beta-lactamase superfamily)